MMTDTERLMACKFAELVMRFAPRDTVKDLTSILQVIREYANGTVTEQELAHSIEPLKHYAAIERQTQKNARTNFERDTAQLRESVYATIAAAGNLDLRMTEVKDKIIWAARIDAALNAARNSYAPGASMDRAMESIKQSIKIISEGGDVL